VRSKILAKANSTIQAALQGETIRFTVLGARADGTDTVLELDLGRLSDKVQVRAMLHGMIQRISDAAALGKGASAADKAQAMQRLIEHYSTGTEEWGVRREGGAGGGGRSSIVYAAIAEVHGIGIEDAKARVASLAERKGVKVADMLRTLAAADKVAEVVRRIEGERNRSKGVDGQALLDELGEDES
jgi:hypothetical protein